jgi:PP-loop superfamily ATP-utilizing enzyme
LSDKLVERLRHAQEAGWETLNEAADRIEALERALRNVIERDPWVLTEEEAALVTPSAAQERQ